MTVKSATFRGKRYRVVFAACKYGGRAVAGLCSKPTEKNKAIILDPGLDEQHLIVTATHEALHACVWDLDEEAVDEISRDIARFLWRLGYRRHDRPE